MKPFKRFFPRANLLICLAFFIFFLYLLATQQLPGPGIFFVGLFSIYCLGSSLIIKNFSPEPEITTRKVHREKSAEKLNGLNNKKEFISCLEDKLNKTHNQEKKFGLALISLNYPQKEISSQARDKANQEISSFILAKTQTCELTGRLEEDKFVLFMPEDSKTDVLRAISELHNDLIEAEFDIGGQKTKIIANIGLAFYPQDGQTAEQLMNKAGKYLEDAIKGKNQICSSHDNIHDFNIQRNTSFHSSNYFLDKIAKKSTQLFLLFQEKEIEIIKQEIDENKRFVIEKADGLKGFEFFYILKGEVLHIEQNRVLSPGNFIKTGSSDKRIHFKTLTPVTFLYITNLPVFIKQTNEIKKMAEMISRAEQKDLTTESHGFRLQEMAVQIVEAMEELEDDKLFSLIYAAYLHDIGKLKVPTNILRKEGSLTPDEWEIIKKHPTWGSEIIKEKLQNSNTEDIAEIVHQHHENYDGTGYPRGLKGDQIRIEAQILSLLDTFDSMTSDRPYQKAKTKEEAIEEIKRGSGTRFNPKIVNHFLKIIKQKDEKR